MSVISSSSNGSQSVHVYRLPARQNYRSVPQVRSPSPDSRIMASQRRASIPSSTVRIVEVKSPKPTTYIKRFYPQQSTTRIIREQSEYSTDTDSTPSPPPVMLVKRRPQESRIVRVATTSTNTSSNADVIVPIVKKNRRAFIETPVAIVSETPMVHRGTSPRKQWKKRDRTVPLDLERDVYVSDEDYYEEAFPDGTYKPKSYKFCKWCNGKCARSCPQCNFCEWYYSCPCCVWFLCLFLSLGLLIGILTLFALLPEINPSRRAVNTQQVNTTINAIQQNLPCDPTTTYNASSTLIRCIDTTPVYIYTVVAQSYGRGSRLGIVNSLNKLTFLVFILFSLELV